MVTKPTKCSDYYGAGFIQNRNKQKMKGPTNLCFGAIRCDEDKAKKFQSENAFLDTAPCKPESIAFKMRPRDKSKEIGPPMKHSTHFQQ